MHEHHTLDNLSREFLEHMRHPHNQGVLANPSGTAMMIGQCGDSIAIGIHVDADVIRGIRVLPRGCAFTVAEGKTLDEALRLEPRDIVREIGGLAEDHQHCARLALNVLGEAITDYLERSGKHSR
jgi:nitrogen fixation NifU-like protein